MDQIYEGLTEEQRDVCVAYAAARGLAFESGALKDGTFYVRPLPGDEGAPQWTGEALTGLEEIFNGEA